MKIIDFKPMLLFLEKIVDPTKCNVAPNIDNCRHNDILLTIIKLKIKVIKTDQIQIFIVAYITNR